MIATLLLAAGSARRFGGPKLLQVVQGKAIARWSAETALAATGALFVVVPPDHAGIREALDGLDVRFVVNHRATDGMGSSLACGASGLTKDVDAAIVALADEPMLGVAPYQRVIERFRAGGAKVVASMYERQRGHPVLFDRAVFPELTTLTGDHGARKVVDREPARVAFVEMGAQHPVDVDTREDLARLLANKHL
jgi:molybdenum cofactor cytidylyltransferase